MALGHHGHITDRKLERTAALLPDNEAGDRSIHLARKKTLGTHRQQTQHIMQSSGHSQVLRQNQGLQAGITPRIRKGLLRDIAEQDIQLDIHRRGIIGRVMEDKTQVACDLAQHLAVHLFPDTDGLKLLDILRPDQEAVAFLVFGHIDLQHRHGGIAHPDVANLHPAAGFFHQLLEHIGRPASALVMDHINEGLIAHLVAGADDAVHLLFHLGIAALYRVEVQLRGILPLQHAGGGAAAKADPVGRPAHLDNEHALLLLFLFGMAVVDLAHTGSEHDRFQIAPALAIGKTQVKGTGKTLDQRLAEFVAVIRGAVAGINLDLQGGGQIIGTGIMIFPAHGIAGDMEIAHAVAGSAGDDKTTPARPLDITDPATSPGLGTGEGGDTGGEVMGLSSK